MTRASFPVRADLTPIGEIIPLIAQPSDPISFLEDPPDCFVKIGKS